MKSTDEISVSLEIMREEVGDPLMAKCEHFDASSERSQRPKIADFGAIRGPGSELESIRSCQQTEEHCPYARWTSFLRRYGTV